MLLYTAKHTHSFCKHALPFTSSVVYMFWVTIEFYNKLILNKSLQINWYLSQFLISDVIANLYF